ncbi:MAG TPA: hypothetical protein PKA65_12670, partial [Solirubrobacterales bacterium]|nr:hypothetical protein [Solirubrobacterales bacterium]
MAEAKPGPKPKLAVSIVDAGQNSMFVRGVLKVKVRSDRRGTIRLRGLSSTFDGNGVMKPLTRVAWPKFKRAGQWRTIDLPLTAAGLT